MSSLIAVLDDEEDIVQLVSLHLRKAGFSVEGFTDVGSFYNFIESQSPDLIILDIMLPDADGFEICKYLKKQDNFSLIPIIMLTAKGEETDKVLGLELGADDYVTKPFSPRELVARVKAVLRRHEQKDDGRKINIGGILTIDTEKYEVTVNGEKVELTTTEFKILQLLCSKKSWVFTRNQILDHLWGDEKYVLDRTIDVHVRNLREKLGDAEKFIKSVRGIGYKLED
jgi:DNA-binding response OmpR family regulator